jgi:hypothetical protein
MEFLTYNALKTMFPANRHRLSHELFRPDEPQWSGDHGVGAMIAGRCYVLRGSVIHQFGDRKIETSAGNFSVLPGGDYKLFLGKGDTELVYVWKRPPAFRTE